MPNTICPFASQHILHGEEDNRPTIHPIASALHIAVTTADGDSLGRYFDREDIKDDSTFYVDAIGGLWQFGPVNRKANAQFDGNSICVSIETEGMDGPLNNAQIQTLIKLYAWLNTEWGISLDLSDSWNGPGAGWHSKYHQWNYDSHDCPKQARVDQLVNTILPAARAMVAGQSHPASSPEEDMPAKFVVADPFSDSPAPGQEPHFIVFEQPDVSTVAVARLDGATFGPIKWSEGQKTLAFEDFVFMDLKWRKFKNITGKPTGAFSNSRGVFFTAEGTAGCYQIAAK